MLKGSLGSFRAIALLEGISFLVLLFIAMPLKYWADWPYAVKYVGMAHGVLFVLYLAALLVVSVAHRWHIFRITGAFIASFLPFGTFVFDARLRKSS
ncbi:DUF3817 domain-containing protein [Paenibacillus sp. y28]|uniref:DUF3817 domain-containing protein n=1 Tax=Paenibacillus sp. y28 TaxID=3129110 RepID=UPI0030191B1B